VRSLRRKRLIRKKACFYRSSNPVAQTNPVARRRTGCRRITVEAPGIEPIRRAGRNRTLGQTIPALARLGE
jgi:hypothetical protein